MRTNENYFRWKFRQYREHMPNFVYAENSDSAPEQEEHPVAQITLNDSSVISVTDTRLFKDEQPILRYVDVLRCNWIDADLMNTSRTKANDYDRLVFDMRDGSTVVIEGLGQAVFPMLSFFHNKLRKRQNIRPA